ncbi:MAG TPA: ROK family protein [Erysipelotrichaceae bacterium]|nr:ROK family protein [Erysipelotrichaceae bacterium]
MRYYVAVDIGGTEAKLGIIDSRGKIHSKMSVAVSFDQYETPIIDTVIKGVEQLIEIQGVKRNYSGIAVSAAGQIDVTLGKVIGTNGHIKNYEGTNIKQRLEEKFGIPVTVINDANAMVLGECWKGSAKSFTHVLGVTIGTGVGGGVVIDGHLLQGHRGIAGEIGHFPINYDGTLCSCGNIGCFETVASMNALIERVKKLQVFPMPFNGRDIFNHLVVDEIANEVDQWIADMSAGLVGLIHIFNPQIVVIGGGVSYQKTHFLDPLRNKVLEKVMPCFGEQLVIEAATCGNDAGMLGALYHFISQMDSKGRDQ